MQLKDKLIVWLYNKMNTLEKKKDGLKHQRRYELMDSLDLYEMMRADIRIDAFNEFVNDLFKILMYCDL